MNLDNLPPGENVSHDINLIIEMPSHGSPVKYEVDRGSGTLMVDGYVGVAMFYPGNDGILQQISHFFEQYKALDSGKWVKEESWEGLKKPNRKFSTASSVTTACNG